MNRLLKVLLQLILVLFLSTLLAQLIILPATNDQVFEKQIDWRIQFISKGTIDLTADELNHHGELAYERVLTQIRPDYGFTIELVKLTSFDEVQQSKLSSGQLTTNVANASVYKLLNNGTTVLAFVKIDKAASHIISEAEWYLMGTINSLKRQLFRSPEENWSSRMIELSKLFDFKVEMVELSSLMLNKEQREQLEKGNIVWGESENSKELEYPFEIGYSKLGKTKKVLVIGPIAEPIMDRIMPVYFKYYLMFSLLILIPVMIWITPTWISLNKLSKASGKFGLGDFSARSPIIKGSNINQSSRVFNNMASKIQGLITVNKSLINAVSHELRTPLSRIEFDLELARNSEEQKDRELIHDRIEHSVDELKTLVNEMLGYAKFEQQKPDLTIERVELNQWLHSEMEACQSASERKIIALSSNTGAQLSDLDRYYMSRVVSNLVGNALKYANTKVQLSLGFQNEKNFISIEDDGPGIPEADRKNVFGAFIRLDKSRNRNTGGTGLGLAIVKQIMQWHKGDVEISDSKLGGVRMIISWPNQLNNL